MDQAVGYFGRTVDNELDKVEGKNEREIERKRKLVLAKYIDLGEARASGFADPAKMFG